jgi:hypothetical protein
MFDSLLLACAPYVFPVLAAVVVYVYGHLPVKEQEALQVKTTYLRNLMLDVVMTVEATSSGLAGPDKAEKAKVAFSAAVKDLSIKGVPTSLIATLLEPAVATMKAQLVPVVAPVNAETGASSV